MSIHAAVAALDKEIEAIDAFANVFCVGSGK